MYKILYPGKPSDFILTAHAAEQYVSRWNPELSIEEAGIEIYNLLQSVQKIGKSPRGDDIFASTERPEVRFVIKDKNVCVTILPFDKGDYGKMLMEQAAIDDERKEYIESQSLILNNLIKEVKDELSILVEDISKLDNKKETLLRKKRSLVLRKEELTVNLNKLKLI